MVSLWQGGVEKCDVWTEQESMPSSITYSLYELGALASSVGLRLCI